MSLEKTIIYPGIQTTIMQPHWLKKIARPVLMCFVIDRLAPRAYSAQAGYLILWEMSFDFYFVITVCIFHFYIKDYSSTLTNQGSFVSRFSISAIWIIFWFLFNFLGILYDVIYICYFSLCLFTFWSWQLNWYFFNHVFSWIS